MIEPYIIAGSALFWLYSVLSFLAAVCFMAFNRTGKAITTLLVYAGVIILFTDANAIAWLRANWLTALTYIGGYLAIGTVYMLFRWRMLSGQVAGIYADIRAEFLETNKIKEITTPAEKDDLKRTVSRNYKLNQLGVEIPMLVRQNKARLTNWLTLWVFSAVEYILGDLLVNVVNGIVRTFSGFMQNITNRQFAKFSELN